MRQLDHRAPVRAELMGEIGDRERTSAKPALEPKRTQDDLTKSGKSDGHDSLQLGRASSSADCSQGQRPSGQKLPPYPSSRDHIMSKKIARNGWRCSGADSRLRAQHWARE
ncbi:hypothetical protein DB30_04048 [Enhygromyxa salina]|uniref:Uncharacterized protein n=1 Tax=Enhygromyxa salina TaxID=215803 RepID=A0A0C2D0X6_9BACT|nr:hypothetical protein DB30_04048 [Enhygromyxa salina]